MKGTILSVAMLAASVCAADEVLSSNVIGQLPVTSSSKRTIVSVPWCAMSATDDAAIQVSNLVKTANLTAGDMLHYVKSDGKYLSWRLSNTTVKYWESVQLASDANSVSESPDSSGQTVARGNSIILIRQNPTNELGVAQTFYLYGQVGTNKTVSSSIAPGSATSAAYSLIASPKPASWTVNGSDHSWSNVGAKDNLFVYDNSGMMIPLYWSGSLWGASNDVWKTVGGKKVRSGKTFAEYTTEIPAGTGVWYVSNGGDDTPSVTWSED